MRPYPRFGGESVSFATTSFPAHTLFFIFTSFHTIAFIRLIRFASQTCAPCAFNNAQVCDPTLSATKKRAARAPFLWRRECIIRKDFSRPARTLFFIFTSFHTIAFVRLIRFASQTCAPCAFKNAQVCDPTLSATKKEARLGSFSVAERVGFEPTKPFMGAYTISSRARSTGLRHLSNFGCLSIIHYFTPIVKRLS